MLCFKACQGGRFKRYIKISIFCPYTFIAKLWYNIPGKFCTRQKDIYYSKKEYQNYNKVNGDRFVYATFYKSGNNDDELAIYLLFNGAYSSEPTDICC